MTNLPRKELKTKFMEEFSKINNCIFDKGQSKNPFLIEIDVNPYFIFLKNISSAAFKGSENITRIQLADSKGNFKEVLKSDTPFIIFGYDTENEVVVCWNPHTTKARLNAKKNVSLYSRKSAQIEVKAGEFKTTDLNNGDIIQVFKMEMLQDFFHQLPTLFPNTLQTDSKKKSEITTKTTINLSLQTKLNMPSEIFKGIEDEEVLDEIMPLLQKNKVLQAVQVCRKYYQDKTKMNFRSWFEEVEQLYNSKDLVATVSFL